MTEPLYYDKDGNPTGMAEKCACGALYRLSARRGFLLNGSMDVPRMPEPAERVDAAFELARLQLERDGARLDCAHAESEGERFKAERDAAQATIRTIERAATQGNYLCCTSLSSTGREWAFMDCNLYYVGQFHDTPDTAIAAWSAANPEVK